MSNEDLTIRLGLQGQAKTEQGLKKTAAATKLVQDAQGRWRHENGRFATSAEKAAAGIEAIGAKSSVTGARVRKAGADLNVFGGTVGFVTRQAKYAGAGLLALTIAGAKWGLGTNAQIEQARLRFSLFTDDIDGLTASVVALDKRSAFTLSDLLTSAATLGGSGIKDVPGVLQAVANAAAGGGKGLEGLKGITIALSQIQSKGRLSQEEVNQLTEGGAITAQRDLAKGLNLTTKELQNLGGEGIEAGRAIDVLTKAWTSGQMADIAERQTRTLGGQWNMLTGNMQTASGAATKSLAAGLRDEVLPAANKSLTEITKLFGNEGLSNEEKLRQARRIIDRELGPIADDLLKKLDDADIPGHLGALVGAAAPKMAAAAADAAPEAAKAFVDAWLASGPWVQLLTALAVYKKLGAPGLPGKGGKGGSPVDALMKTRGATPQMPLFVAVVNDLPDGPGGKGKGGWKDWLKGAAGGAATRTRTAAQVARTVVGVGGEAAGAGGLSALAAGGGIAYLAATHNENFPTRGPGASSPSNPAGHVPFTGGRLERVGDPVQINTSLTLDERVVAKSTHQVELRRQGRSG